MSRGGGFSAASLRATSQSCSALRTHLAVSRFIKYLALLDDLTQKPIVVLQAAFDLPGRAYNQVERKQSLERRLDADGLIDRVLGPHDDEQIDIALVMWFPVGIGAEQ